MTVIVKHAIREVKEDLERTLLQTYLREVTYLYRKKKDSTLDK